MKKLKLIIIFLIGITLVVTSVYAASTLSSDDVLYSNEKSGLTSTTVKSAIDELSEKESTYCPDGKSCVENYTCSGSSCKKCVRAKVLHTETCENGPCYTDYGTSKHYAAGEIITYGKNGKKGTLSTGDAFDCDVNGDGIYNQETERFYYVSDYYNTTSKTFNTNYAVLIYYKNYINELTAYDSTHGTDSANSVLNAYGPITAVKNLPKTSEWSNVSLLNTKRQILTETGGTTVVSSNDPSLSGTLPIFDYSGYAARLITSQEIESGCNNTWDTSNISGHYGDLDHCNFFFENAYYVTNENRIYGHFTENAFSVTTDYVFIVHAGPRNINPIYSYKANDSAVRPAIEVSKTDIDY